jgi:hypothetical protein
LIFETVANGMGGRKRYVGEAFGSFSWSAYSYIFRVRYTGQKKITRIPAENLPVMPPATRKNCL